MSAQDDLSIEEFKLPEGDEVSSHWKSMLDLESAAKREFDWYSTRTFELFLDALDINQPPVILEDKNHRRPKPEVKGEDLKPTLSTKETSNANQSKNEVKGQPERGHHQVETILSAEALKILSELPDLSHMSSTRSLIFPGERRPQR